MDGPIQRVEPARILPLAGPGRAGERKAGGGKRFALDSDAGADSGADQAEEREETAQPLDRDRPVGPAPDDEAGTRIDLTA